MLWNLVDPGSELWTSCLPELRHDIYHFPDYVRLCADLYEGGMPRAFIARDDEGVFLMPLILRPIEAQIGEPELFDAVGPYGYASPICAVRAGCDETRFVERALEALLTCLREEHAVTVFCRLNPMLSLPHEPLQKFGSVLEHGPTVYCDLNRTNREMWLETRESVRRQIARMEAEGHVGEEDTAWRCLEDFQECYADTMRRVGAADWYFFDSAYFSGLRDSLAANLHLLVVRLGEQVVCAGLFSETCGLVQYHLGGTRNGFESTSASKLLIHYGRQWAKERGNHTLHLGGGVGAANDSLMYFKSSFSRLRGSFHTWRLIVDPPTYSDLVARRQSEIAGARSTSFFPEYRIGDPKTVWKTLSRSTSATIPQEVVVAESALSSTDSANV